MTLFGNRTFADVIVRMRPYWIGVGPNPMTGVLIRRPCDDGDRFLKAL